MATLSAITGGSFSKLAQFEVTTPTCDGSYQNVDISSASFVDATKMSINLTSSFTSAAVTAGFRIQDKDTLQYKIEASAADPAFLTFEVIEYS